MADDLVPPRPRHVALRQRRTSAVYWSLLVALLVVLAYAAVWLSLMSDPIEVWRPYDYLTAGSFDVKGPAPRGARVTLYVNGEEVGHARSSYLQWERMFTPYTAANWTLPITLTEIGDFVVVAKASDPLGLINHVSEPVTYRIGPPRPPTLDTRALSINESGAVFLRGACEPYLSVRVMVDGAILHRFTPCNGQDWDARFEPKRFGTHRVQVSTVDSEGKLLAAGRASTVTIGPLLTPTPEPTSYPEFHD